MSNTSQAQYFSIVPASGIGARMDANIPKQYLTILGKPILEYSIQALLNIPVIKQIVVVVAPEDFYWKSLSFLHDPRILIAMGAAERQGSVLNGLLALQSIARAEDWVLIHDAARPCVRQSDILHLIKSLAEHPVGGILGAPVRDTLKRCSPDGKILETVPRQHLWQAFTPQMFRYQLLLETLQAGHVVTDEASALELSGHIPQMVQGRSDNIKVTFPEDLKLVEYYLRAT